MENSQEVEKRTQNSSVKKLFVTIGFLILLLIPLAFVENTITERENYRKEAINNVVKSWAEHQVIKLPELIVYNQKQTTLELEDLQTDAKINSEIRKKGIFKVPVYTANIKIKGAFFNPDKDIKGILIFPVEDSRGYSDIPSIKINGTAPNICADNSCKIDIKNAPKQILFEAEYNLKGTEKIGFEVGGKVNKLNVSGNWADPSFEGDFLPISRKVSSKGFEASWSVPKIATSDEKLETISSNIGVKLKKTCDISLLTPVDNYRMTLRTVKYGFLFLALTFLAFFVFEITSKDKPIHPFQYGLIGLSMIIFYLLLISISEFLPFCSAYVIATFMTVSLITGYTHFVLTKKTNKGFSGLMAGILTLLYVYLYTILNLQDFSLLFGSFGIFFAILIVMYATRNVEWYKE